MVYFFAITVCTHRITVILFSCLCNMDEVPNTPACCQFSVLLSEFSMKPRPFPDV
jgi:hypothetical protein